MAPKFGTSGLRGLVVELTPERVANYVNAFLVHLGDAPCLYIGRDLRASSVELSAVVRDTAVAAGANVVDCGVLPTPAMALAALEAGAASIMITGSHIPADRNGLKFFTATGEISKADEQAIQSGYEAGLTPPAADPGESRLDEQAATRFADRYVTGYGNAALAGLTVGVYEHSSAARDILCDVLAALGATPVPLARSDAFIPVDTEAVDPDTCAMLADWCQTHGLDAVVSTDGDADRPMLTDATGKVVPGDILGVITARSLKARAICTPISSNSMVSELSEFDTVTLTRIGSPYVIAAMEDSLASRPEALCAGFEANGGFLLGGTAQGPAGALGPLMTRDCLLPIIATLAAAKTAGSVRALVGTLPPRATAADRLQEVPRPAMEATLARLDCDADALAAFLAPARATDINRLDGLRITMEGGAVVHLRPSGNAPEMRVYAEADTETHAQEVLATFLARVRTEVDSALAKA